jgi:hypothetical protein
MEPVPVFGIGLWKALPPQGTNLNLFPGCFRRFHSNFAMTENMHQIQTPLQYGLDFWIRNLKIPHRFLDPSIYLQTSSNLVTQLVSFFHASLFLPIKYPEGMWQVLSPC